MIVLCVGGHLDRRSRTCHAMRPDGISTALSQVFSNSHQLRGELRACAGGVRLVSHSVEGGRTTLSNIFISTASNIALSLQPLSIDQSFAYTHPPSSLRLSSGIGTPRAHPTCFFLQFLTPFLSRASFFFRLAIRTSSFSHRPLPIALPQFIRPPTLRSSLHNLNLTTFQPQLQLLQRFASMRYFVLIGLGHFGVGLGL